MADTYIQSLAERVETAERTAHDIRRAHSEAALEFDRVKERLRRSHQDEVVRSRERLVAAFFEIGDNLDRTIDVARGQGSASNDSLVTGVAMVRDQLFRVLAEFGVERFSPHGQLFDPNAHEGLGVVAVTDETQDGRVVEVFKPGFRSGDRILRPALVQIGKLAS